MNNTITRNVNKTILKNTTNNFAKSLNLDISVDKNNTEKIIKLINTIKYITVESNRNKLDDARIKTFANYIHHKLGIDMETAYALINSCIHTNKTGVKSWFQKNTTKTNSVEMIIKKLESVLSSEERQQIFSITLFDKHFSNQNKTTNHKLIALIHEIDIPTPNTLDPEKINDALLIGNKINCESQKSIIKSYLTTLSKKNLEDKINIIRILTKINFTHESSVGNILDIIKNNSFGHDKYIEIELAKFLKSLNLPDKKSQISLIDIIKKTTPESNPEVNTLLAMAIQNIQYPCKMVQESIISISENQNLGIETPTLKELRESLNKMKLDEKHEKRFLEQLFNGKLGNIELYIIEFLKVLTIKFEPNQEYFIDKIMEKNIQQIEGFASNFKAFYSRNKISEKIQEKIETNIVKIKFKIKESYSDNVSNSQIKTSSSLHLSRRNTSNFNGEPTKFNSERIKKRFTSDNFAIEGTLQETSINKFKKNPSKDEYHYINVDSSLKKQNIHDFGDGNEYDVYNKSNDSSENSYKEKSSNTPSELLK